MSKKNTNLDSIRLNINVKVVLNGIRIILPRGKIGTVCKYDGNSRKYTAKFTIKRRCGPTLHINAELNREDFEEYN